jgi:hypothetical protein
MCYASRPYVEILGVDWQLMRLAIRPSKPLNSQVFIIGDWNHATGGVWEVIDAAKPKPFGFMPFYPGPGLGEFAAAARRSGCALTPGAVAACHA